MEVAAGVDEELRRRGDLRVRVVAERLPLSERKDRIAAVRAENALEHVVIALEPRSGAANDVDRPAEAVVAVENVADYLVAGAATVRDVDRPAPVRRDHNGVVVDLVVPRAEAAVDLVHRDAAGVRV